MKIGIAFSGGGHFLEAMKACKLIIEDPANQVFFVTNNLVQKNDMKNTRYFVTHPKHGFFLRRLFLFFINAVESFRIYKKEKPDVIISTGADITLAVMLIAKLFNKKVIFIESGASVTKPSMTGKIIYRFSDAFIVQWEELKIHYPNAIVGTTLL